MNSLVLLPLCFAATLASVIPAHHGIGVHYAAAPAVVGSYGVARSQYHAQDAYGTYNYGYAEPNGAKKETRHPDGTVTGSYSHPLPDGSILTNNYVADEYGFRSNLAPTAPKDFAPVVKAAYNVAAPVVAHTVGHVAIPQPALHVTKSVNYAAPALVKGYGAYQTGPYAGPYAAPAYAPHGHLAGYGLH